MKYNLKVYSDYYGVFESFADPFTREQKKKIIKTLKDRGAIVRWYGSFYKLATPYNVFFPDCECECCCDSEECEGGCCECQPLIDSGDDIMTLEEYKHYKIKRSDDEDFFPILTSEDGLFGYPTKQEVFCVDLGDRILDLRDQKGFSFYADTDKNESRILACHYSGLFKDRDFFKWAWL